MPSVGDEDLEDEERGPLTSHEERPLIVEEISDGVWRSTLSSPNDRNALSGAVRQSLLTALHEARAGGAKVMIVRGDDRVFSSGYKLDPGVMRPKTATEDRDRLVKVAEFMRDYRAQPVVTIAEIRGYCIAGATDLLIASDLSLASTDALIGVPNVRGVGITLLLPVWSWMVGPQRAKLLALAGDFMTGEEAASFGFVAAALPHTVLEGRVIALAERIALIPRELLEVTKQALNVAWDTAGLDSVLLRAAELDALSHTTQPVVGFWDQVECQGMRAAVEARDAAFREGRSLELVKSSPIRREEPDARSR